jgi:hypothetical protein
MDRFTPRARADKRYLAELEKCKKKTACNRYYIDLCGLRNWMERTETDEHNSNAGHLLHAAQEKASRRVTFPRLDTHSLMRGEDQCLLVFSILLVNRRGELIDLFRSAKIVDRNLEKSSHYHKELRDELKQANIAGVDGIIEDFEREKWPFCPAKLKLNMEEKYHGGKYILPYVRRKKINKGGTAVVSKITIREDMVPEDLRKELSQSACDDPEFGKVSNIFSLLDMFLS